MTTTRPAVPAVRAAYMKNLYAELDRQRSGLLAQLDETLRAEVDSASRAAWLPVSLNVATVEGVVAAMGEESGLQLMADCVYAQFDTPLWSSFIRPAVKLLGSDPGALGRWIPSAMQIVFRDCGTFSAELTDKAELTVSVRDLPRELANHRLWLRSLGIGMRPVFQLSQTQGTADLLRINPGERSAIFRLSWKDSA